MAFSFIFVTDVLLCAPLLEQKVSLGFEMSGMCREVAPGKLQKQEDCIGKEKPLFIYYGNVDLTRSNLLTSQVLYSKCDMFGD